MNREEYPLNVKGEFCDKKATLDLEEQEERKKNILNFYAKTLIILEKHPFWNEMKIIMTRSTFNWKFYVQEVDEWLMDCPIAQSLNIRNNKHVEMFMLLTLNNVCSHQLNKKPLNANDSLLEQPWKNLFYKTAMNIYNWWTKEEQKTIRKTHQSFYKFTGYAYSLTNIRLILMNMKEKKIKTSEGSVFQYLITNEILDEEIISLLNTWKTENQNLKSISSSDSLLYYPVLDEIINQSPSIDPVMIDTLIEERRNLLKRSIEKEKKTWEKNDFELNNEFLIEDNIYDKMFMHPLLFKLCPMNYELEGGDIKVFITTLNQFQFHQNNNKEEPSFFTEKEIGDLYTKYKQNVEDLYLNQ